MNGHLPVCWVVRGEAVGCMMRGGRENVPPASLKSGVAVAGCRGDVRSKWSAF